MIHIFVNIYFNEDYWATTQQIFTIKVTSSSKDFMPYSIDQISLPWLSFCNATNSSRFPLQCPTNSSSTLATIHWITKVTLPPIKRIQVLLSVSKLLSICPLQLTLHFQRVELSSLIIAEAKSPHAKSIDTNEVMMGISFMITCEETELATPLVQDTIEMLENIQNTSTDIIHSWTISVSDTSPTIAEDHKVFRRQVEDTYQTSENESLSESNGFMTESIAFVTTMIVPFPTKESNTPFPFVTSMILTDDISEISSTLTSSISPSHVSSTEYMVSFSSLFTSEQTSDSIVVIPSLYTIISSSVENSFSELSSFNNEFSFKIISPSKTEKFSSSSNTNTTVVLLSTKEISTKIILFSSTTDTSLAIAHTSQFMFSDLQDSFTSTSNMFSSATPVIDFETSSSISMSDDILLPLTISSTHEFLIITTSINLETSFVSEISDSVLPTLLPIFSSIDISATSVVDLDTSMLEISGSIFPTLLPLSSFTEFISIAPSMSAFPASSTELPSPSSPIPVETAFSSEEGFHFMSMSLEPISSSETQISTESLPLLPSISKSSLALFKSSFITPSLTINSESLSAELLSTLETIPSNSEVFPSSSLLHIIDSFSSELLIIPTPFTVISESSDQQLSSSLVHDFETSLFTEILNPLPTPIETSIEQDFDRPSSFISSSIEDFVTPSSFISSTIEDFNGPSSFISSSIEDFNRPSSFVSSTIEDFNRPSSFISSSIEDFDRSSSFISSSIEDFVTPSSFISSSIEDFDRPSSFISSSIEDFDRPSSFISSTIEDFDRLISSSIEDFDRPSSFISSSIEDFDRLISSSIEDFDRPSSFISSSIEDFVTPSSFISSSIEDFDRPSSFISSSIEDFVTPSSFISSTIEDFDRLISSSIEDFDRPSSFISSSIEDFVTPSSFISSSIEDFDRPSSFISSSIEDFVTPSSFISSSIEDFDRPSSFISSSIEDFVTPSSFISSSIEEFDKPISSSIEDFDRPSSFISSSIEDFDRPSSFISSSIEDFDRPSSFISSSIEDFVTPSSFISSSIEEFDKPISSSIEDFDRPSSFISSSIEEFDKPISSSIEDFDRPSSFISSSIEDFDRPSSFISSSIEDFDRPSSFISSSIEDFVRPSSFISSSIEDFVRPSSFISSSIEEFDRPISSSIEDFDRPSSFISSSISPLIEGSGISSSVDADISSTPFVSETIIATFASISQQATSIPTPLDSIPILMNPVGTLVAEEGKIFSYVIPDYTFFDNEDGLTPNLTLVLFTNESWIYLNQPNTIIGLPLSNNIINEAITDYHIELRAYDTNGNYASNTISLRVFPERSSPESFIRIFINGNFISFDKNISAKVDLVTKLSAPGHGSIYVRNFSEGSIAVTFANLSIPNHDCTKFFEWTDSIYENGSYTKTFTQQIDPYELIVSPVVTGTCVQSTHSIQESETPVPSVSISAIEEPVSNQLILLALVVPVVLLACLMLVMGAVAFMLYHRKRPERKYLPYNMLYMDRKPVLLPQEMESVPHRSRKPTILPNEIVKRPHQGYRRYLYSPPSDAVEQLHDSESSLELVDFPIVAVTETIHDSPPPYKLPSIL